MKPLDRLTVPNAASWAHWLLSNASTSPGVSLTLAKKGTSEPTSLSQDEAVEEALCHGWINGQGHSLDSGTHMQRFTPRAAKSVWSKRNVGIVERLEVEGRMRDAGRAVVEAAKADGRWERAYSGSANLEEMQDLLDAIKADPPALSAWESLPKGQKSQIYFRLSALRTQAGREKCIRNFVDRLQDGEKASVAPSKAATKSKVQKRSVSVRDGGELEEPEPLAKKSRVTRSGRQVRVPGS